MEMFPEMHEKIGVLTAKADAAHSRLDRLEVVIKKDLEGIQADLKELTAYMNKGKAYAGALIFVSGFAGAGVAKVLSIIFSIKG